LEKLMASALRRARAGEGPVLAWPLACGSTVAERTRALDFSHGVLRVEVPDVGWRKELQSFAPQYLAVINRYVGESVKRIEFIVPGQQVADKADKHVRSTRV
jgi:predicted nucleic acid-binding Zn ribbon protein